MEENQKEQKASAQQTADHPLCQTPQMLKQTEAQPSLRTSSKLTTNIDENYLTIIQILSVSFSVKFTVLSF